MITEFKDIDQLSPADFEVFVKDLFLASGWSDAVITEVGKEYRHGDGGVDIFASKGNRKFAIEVKQRGLGTNVDVGALNQLIAGADLANVKNRILVTNSYFTSEVLARALRLGVELIDRDALQNLWIVKHSEIGRDIKPRKYQQEVIDQALKQYHSGKSRILIEMATGLGKTYTVAHLVKSLIQQSGRQHKVLFLAHQVELLFQSVTAFKNVLGIGNYSFSACFSGSEPEDTDFVFATFDTLYGQLHKLKMDAFDFIVVDEAHHTPARTYSEVVTTFSPKFLVGLTATPYRADNRNVIDFFGGDEGHIGKYDLVWALKHRKLAFPRYLVLLDDLNQDRINQLESGLSISDLDKRLFLHKKDEEVVRIIEKTVTQNAISNPKGIVFCRSIRHMRHLINFFALGTATMVHSKMSDQERRVNIRNFREGNFSFILVCDLFNEGIDIPETNLLIFMRYTGSRTIWLQQLGRGLRKTPNKEFVHVLDFVGSLDRLNEVRRLAKQVEKAKVDRESLLDEDEPRNNEELHDGTLEVIYSEEAARVLELIENLNLLLNSREALIEKLRLYREEFQTIPSIHELEEKLESVGCDQIATHFGSYLGYLMAAFGTDIYASQARKALQDYKDTYFETYGLEPSVKAIALHFMEKQLYAYSESEIKALLPNYKDPSPPTENPSANVPPLEARHQESTPDRCELIEKYKGTPMSRSDIKSLPADEQEAIKLRYRSVSVFLKKLKEA